MCRRALSLGGLAKQQKNYDDYSVIPDYANTAYYF